MKAAKEKATVRKTRRPTLMLLLALAAGLLVQNAAMAQDQHDGLKNRPGHSESPHLSNSVKPTEVN